MALICYATTQVRTLSNISVLAIISLICVAGNALTQLLAIWAYGVEGKQEAKMFGNPEREHSLYQFARGLCITVFGFVPSFLAVELSSCIITLSFRDTWQFADCLKYAMYTLRAFMFAFLMALFFPRLDLQVTVLTFATVP